MRASFAVALLAGCGSSSGPAPSAGSGSSGSGAAVVAAAPVPPPPAFPTFVLATPSAAADSAVMLACAASPKYPSDTAATCADLVGHQPPLSVISLAPADKPLALGARKAVPCTTGPSQPGFAISSSTVADRFLISPPSRRADLVLANRAPTVTPAVIAAMTSQAAAVFEYLPTPSGKFHTISDAIIRSSVDADIDGDGQPDTIYSVEVPTPRANEMYLSILFGAMSRQSGALAPLFVSKDSHALAVAALDVDKDGSAELLVTSTGYHMTGAYLVKYGPGAPDGVDGTAGLMTPFGAWFCGD
ncbi:MAG TPA: VCBS repeat-containing protein [Kofleriaceae bacterium]|jgi:hypothetical protein